MAFKLTASQLASRDHLDQSMNEAHAALKEGITQFNEKLEKLRAELEDIERVYNERVQAVRDFMEEVTTAAEEEFEPHSEQWKESEEGEAAQKWMEEWFGALNTLEDLSIEYPQDIVLDDIEEPPVLAELPETPED